MSDDLTTQLQEIDAACDDDEAAINAALEAQRNSLNTSLPGIVKSYDPDTQTVQVRPAIQRIFREMGAVELPLLVDVPVHFPRGGNFVLTFPIAKGDECLLSFSQRCIDFWWAKGGVQLPAELRTHDLSDAFACVGYSSKPRVVANASTDSVELRTLDGAAKVSIDGGNNIDCTTNAFVRLNAPPGANQMTNGVVIAGDTCPVVGMPYGVIGCGASRVFAGKT
jgi:hypothetical protein